MTPAECRVAVALFPVLCWVQGMGRPLNSTLASWPVHGGRGCGEAERCSQAWVGAVSLEPQRVPLLQVPGGGGSRSAGRAWRMLPGGSGWAFGWAFRWVGRKTFLALNRGGCEGPAGGGGRPWERRQRHTREGLGCPTGEFWFTQKLFGLLFIYFKSSVKKKKSSWAPLVAQW